MCSCVFTLPYGYFCKYVRTLKKFNNKKLFQFIKTHLIRFSYTNPHLYYMIYIQFNNQKNLNIMYLFNYAFTPHIFMHTWKHFFLSSATLWATISDWWGGGGGG